MLFTCAMLFIPALMLNQSLVHLYNRLTSDKDHLPDNWVGTTKLVLAIIFFPYLFFNISY